MEDMELCEHGGVEEAQSDSSPLNTRASLRSRRKPHTVFMSLGPAIRKGKPGQRKGRLKKAYQGSGRDRAIKSESVSAIRSDLTEEQIVQIREEYHIPEEVVTVVPGVGDRADSPPPGMKAIYVISLAHGLRLPAHPFVSDLLLALDRPPAQLTPNSWISITSFIVACCRAGINPEVDLFRSMYMLKPQGDFSFFQVRVQANILLEDMPRKSQLWLPHFFFASNCFKDTVRSDFDANTSIIRVDMGDNHTSAKWNQLFRVWKKKTFCNVFLNEQTLALVGISGAPCRIQDSLEFHIEKMDGDIRTKSSMTDQTYGIERSTRQTVNAAPSPPASVTASLPVLTESTIGDPMASRPDILESSTSARISPPSCKRMDLNPLDFFPATHHCRGWIDSSICRTPRPSPSQPTSPSPSAVKDKDAVTNDMTNGIPLIEIDDDEPLSPTQVAPDLTPSQEPSISPSIGVLYALPPSQLEVTSQTRITSPDVAASLMNAIDLPGELEDLRLMTQAEQFKECAYHFTKLAQYHKGIVDNTNSYKESAEKYKNLFNQVREDASILEKKMKNAAGEANETKKENTFLRGKLASVEQELSLTRERELKAQLDLLGLQTRLCAAEKENLRLIKSVEKAKLEKEQAVLDYENSETYKMVIRKFAADSMDKTVLLARRRLHKILPNFEDEMLDNLTSEVCKEERA